MSLRSSNEKVSNEPLHLVTSMDPVTAFSLAGTILQFIDCGTRFVGMAWNLHRSGLDQTALGSMLRITNSLESILPELKSIESDNDTDKSLGQLALDCSRTTTRLLAILQKIEKTGTSRKRDVLKAAFRSICKEDEIKSLQDQLSSFRNQLNLHLLLSLREYASKSAKKQEIVLQKLGVVHNQTLSVGGISAYILEYLASRESKTCNQIDEIKSLRQGLIQTHYETYTSMVDREGSGPFAINLSQTDRERAQKLFTASLQYDGMVDRENRIATAHESTFQWVLEDNESKDRPDPRPPTTRWSSMRKWLESDDQIYWITGKAGSGKSTLMKFLCSPTAELSHTADTQVQTNYGITRECVRCHPYLKKLAGGSGLIVASFYFWNSGTELQMSRAGLLRTLLCQVAAQRPDIIPVISPKEWESACLFNHCIENWSSGELHHMLFRAVEALRDDSRIIFFVDGLDEFEGNHEDLISLVKDVIKENSHVKACVASRPWNLFQAAFRQEANLRLEDLTFDDIKNFVKDKFHADSGFENLRQRHPSFADKLMDNVVVKASGVFLWVDLVVTSLLAGMRLGDRIEDFQRRLDELPPDLEKLYEKILHSLDAFYLEHAAQYFTLVESAEGPLTILQFSFADEESPQTAIKMAFGSMGRDEMSLRVDAVNKRLNSRCKGFLETDRGLQSVQGNSKCHSSQLTVQYLHRTVRDFIKSPKAQSFLRSSTNLNFDPSIQLCVAYLMDLKTWTRPQDLVDILDRDIEEPPKAINVVQCLRRAAGVAKANEGAMIQLLEELKRVINQPDCKSVLMKDREYAQIHRPPVQNFSPKIRPSLFPVQSFLALTVINGVVPYVRARAEPGALVQRRELHQSKQVTAWWPLLMDALSGDVPDPAMVKCLLDLGADPNFHISKVDSQTPWIVALTKVSLLYILQTGKDGSAQYSVIEEKWKQTLRLMFSRGADGAKVPERLLSPISRKILQDLRNERETKRKSQTGLSSWFPTWKPE